MKVWIDVTGLYHWRGNFTGIQRVMYNIVEQTESSDLDCGLFVYHSGVYSEVTFNNLEQHLKEVNRKSQSQQEYDAPRYLKPSRISYYGIVTTKKLVRGSILDPPLRRAYSLARTSYHTLRGLTLHAHEQKLFNKGDVVIIIDGNWQFNNFAESIVAERAKNGFRLIHVVQDLIAYNNPALASKGANKIIGSYFKKIFKAADGLIAISNSTKNDIEWFLKVNKISNKPKLFTITLGSDFGHSNDNAPAPPAKPLPKEFILAVSTIEVRKNYLAFYYIYNLAFQMGIDLPHLVVVGRKGWMAEETYSLLTSDPKIRGQITIVNANDHELSWLYEHCLFTVFPSFYEGWGLPLVESLMHGKCCISSNTSSMREAGGSLVSYISPYDPAAMMNEIVRLTNRGVRHKMEDDIKDRYNPVTWAQTFKQLRDIVETFGE
jgi:glycosyltransferase involved in cell wall biosynthesis